MGRKPEGTAALTGAGRQARYRARHGLPAVPAAVTSHRPPARQRATTRVRRWPAAIDALVSLQAGYAAWLEALPEATRGGPAGDALQAIADLDLDEIIAIRPPRGFGRDQAAWGNARSLRSAGKRVAATGRRCRSPVTTTRSDQRGADTYRAKAGRAKAGAKPR
jgi:hypothetical protein